MKESEWKKNEGYLTFAKLLATLREPKPYPYLDSIGLRGTEFSMHLDLYCFLNLKRLKNK